MGNQIGCFPQRNDGNDQPEEAPIDFSAAILRTNLFAEELNEIEKTHKYLDELLLETQRHNLELLWAEFNNDINMFVLNNLLMCVQLVDNFDSANSAAKAFKQDIENHITEKLAPLADDGVIHGDRRCFLLHGLPHELSKNYIYVDRHHLQGKKLSQRTNWMRFLKDDVHLNCESIMPMEFIVSWDNLEIYNESEYEKLRAYEYSAAKGTVAINRFCMEEPSSTKKIPKGYVRLRCVDVPLSIKQGTQLLANGSQARNEEYDYSHLSDFNEGVDEVHTESDVPSSEDDDNNSLASFTSGNAMMEELKVRLQAWAQPSSNLKKPVISQNEKFSQPMPKLMDERRPSGILPQNYPNLNLKNKKRRDLQSKLPAQSSSSMIPQITVRKPSRPDDVSLDIEQEARTRNRNHSVVHNGMDHDFINPLPPHTFANGISPRLLPVLDANGKLTTLQKPASSGYESMSSIISHGSSLTSEDMREKWRRTETKKLWEFPVIRRKSKEPVPETCFLEVLMEVESDDEDDTGHETNGRNENGNDSDSDTSSQDAEQLLKEPTYEKRTYLNSVAFASNFCSEFRQIGTEMGLASVAIDKAMVVGATIRCSVPYPGGLQAQEPRQGGSRDPQQDTFRVLYTFTPSIQSKCMPQVPITWRLEGSGRNDDEKWPQHHHVETIESLGTNMIPLGHRSINNTQHENLQQTFEWQVGYAHAENVLLNSLKNVHWRTLMFMSLLYRAFLAPLGPLGIGLEHFRNALYHMCHQEFVSWNDEQPGLHLLSLIRKVYANLAHGRMQNFFIRDHNMLKSIPVQNARVIQSRLKNIQDNIILHLMNAFRNVKPVRNGIYNMPNFVRLYKIITTRNEQDLLQWIWSTNAFQNPEHFGTINGTLRRRKLSRKRRRQHKRQFYMRRAQVTDQNVGAQFERGFEEDSELKHRQKMFNKYLRLEGYQRHREEQEKEMKASQSAESSQGAVEKKSSTLDLHAVCVKNYSGLRRSLLIKFFIEHFLHMAKKSLHFNAFSQAAMYVLHMENLCEILASINSAAVEAQELRNKIHNIRVQIGVDHMRDYIKAKNSKFNFVDEIMDPLSSLSTVPLRPQMHSSNIILGPGSSRELPKPPKLSDSRPRLETPRIQRMSAPNFVQSLRSLPTNNFPVEDDSRDSTMIPRVKDPSVRHLPLVKYLDQPVNRRPSDKSDSGSHVDEESTDL